MNWVGERRTTINLYTTVFLKNIFFLRVPVYHCCKYGINTSITFVYSHVSLETTCYRNFRSLGFTRGPHQATFLGAEMNME